MAITGGTRFGPGTVSFTATGGTAEQFEAEVTGGGVTHSYDDVDQATRMIDTSKRPPSRVRGPDGVKLNLVNNLTATGLYAFLVEHDLETAQLEFTPHTADGASWAGEVTLQLPAEVNASEWGEELKSELTLTAVSLFTFTPAGA